MLEVFKGLDHFDLFLLSPLAFFLLLNIFKPYDPEPHQASTRTQIPDYTFNIDPLAQINSIIQCAWHHPSNWQHIKSPQWLLHKFYKEPQPLPCMIHIVKSTNHGCFLEFPIWRCFFMKYRTTILTYISTQHRHIEKDFWLLLRPLKCSSSPLSTIQTNS